MNIKAFKYGNRLHYEWNTKLLERADSHVFVLGEYGRQLKHHTKRRTFTMRNWSIEFFSSENWFTASAEAAGDGIGDFYCNINLPARIGAGEISFVDLDLDLVRRQGEWIVIDEDEFEANAMRFGYPADLILRARRELDGLQARIAGGRFPFDGSLERFLDRIPAHPSD